MLPFLDRRPGVRITGEIVVDKLFDAHVQLTLQIRPFGALGDLHAMPEGVIAAVLEELFPIAFKPFDDPATHGFRERKL